MPMYDIIIPTYDGEEDTLRCLDSIRENTANHRVIWVDNGSTRSSRHKILERLKGTPYACSWLGRNEGFVKAVNHGIVLGNSPYTIILHNDTIVTPEWLGRLEYPFKRDQTVTCSGPMSNDPVHWQGWSSVKKTMFADMPDFDVKDSAIASSLAEDRFKYQYKQVDSLSFFCVMIKRMTFTENGLLDEDFDMGRMADESFCHKLKAKDKKMVFCPSSFVFHKSGTTFKRLYNDGDMKKADDRNMLLFKRKNP